MYPIDTWLHCAFMKTAFWWLSLVPSGMWLFSFVFAEPLVAQHYSHWQILALIELPRSSRLLDALCASTLGIRTLSQASYENLPLCNWLIVKLLSLLWVKNCKWSHWTPFLWPTVFCWAVMFGFMAKPLALVILCGLCSWANIHGGHKWHNILKLNYCTAYANVVHTPILS